MSNVECPRCGKETITLKQRFQAGKWIDIYCSECGGRMCAQPIVMSIMYFVLTWNILFFGFMAVYESSWAYGVAMVIGWAMLEFFILYMPLTKLRPLKQKDPSESTSIK